MPGELNPLNASGQLSLSRLMQLADRVEAQDRGLPGGSVSMLQTPGGTSFSQDEPHSMEILIVNNGTPFTVAEGNFYDSTWLRFIDGNCDLRPNATNPPITLPPAWLLSPTGATLAQGLPYECRAAGGVTINNQTRPMFVTVPAGGSTAGDQDTRYCTILLFAMGPGDSTITVRDAALFPAPPFTITIEAEQLTVTAGPPGSTIWSVTRGVSGTTAAGHENYCNVCQLRPAVQTILTNPAGIPDTLITVAAPTNFPPFGRFYILVDNEQMLVYDGAGTQTWYVERGVNGTTAAVHGEGTKVYHLLPDVVPQAQQLVFDDYAFLQPGPGNTAVHHEVFQFVRLTSTTLTGNGYYPAVIEVWDSVNRVWVDSYPVWVKDINS